MKDFVCLLLAVVCLFSVGCRHTHDVETNDHVHEATHGHDHGHGDEETPSRAVTLFNDDYQLFMEYPLPVVNQPFQLVAHLTETTAWRPKRKGTVLFHFAHSGGTKVEVSENGPARDGIYLPEVRLPQAGTWILELRFEEQVLRLEDLIVAAKQEDIQAEDEEEGSSISFLMEQQWKVDFALEAVRKSVISETLPVFGRFQTAPGKKTMIKAPVDGILLKVGNEPIQPGQSLGKEQVAAALVAAPPALAEPGDLKAHLIKSKAEFELAQSEHKRIKGLLQEGVVAAYRLEQAATQLKKAEAEYQAAGQKWATVQGSAESATGEPVVIRTPFPGQVTAVFMVPGTFVRAGDPIMEIVNTDLIRLEALVPETEIHRIKGINALDIEMGGHRHHLHLNEGGFVRLAYLGAEVQEKTRTIPVTFELANQEGNFLPGATVKLELIRNEGPERTVIPQEALVFDGGFRVAFVMKGGESFERRIPELGASSAGFVEVRSGLEPGELVVTKGAYLVRLAAMNAGEVGHGHAH